MTKEETEKRLKEAQVFPVATIDDIRYKPVDVPKDFLEDYLKDFAKPTGACWMCKSRLIIEWGLVHGSGYCSSCGIGVKVYHYVKDVYGEEKRIEQALQFHPKNYSMEDDD